MKSRQNFIILILTFCCYIGLYAKPLRLNKVAQIHGLENPESVLITKSYIYVSEMGKESVNRGPFDGGLKRYFHNGALDQKFKLKAKINSPMGMAVRSNIIYLADGYRVVGIHTRTGHLVKSFDLSRFKATFLNDLVLVKSRYLVVTATKIKKVFVIDTVTNRIQLLKIRLKNYAVNGVAHDHGRGLLYIAANEEHALNAYGNGKVIRYKFYQAQNGRFIAKFLQEKSLGRFIDGIDLHDHGRKIILSDWNGVKKTGLLYEMNSFNFKNLKTFSMKTAGLADFDIFPRSKMIVTPSLLEGQVYIYRY